MDDRTKPTNPKDRLAISRVDMGLFPDTAVIYGALGMTEGDLKYGSYNFREAGVLASVYHAAMRRHMARWWNGEDIDQSTGVPHLASALSCIAIIVDAQVNGMLADDRPIRGDVKTALINAEAKVRNLQLTFPNPPERYTQVRKDTDKESNE